MLICLLDFLLKSSNSLNRSMSRGINPKLMMMVMMGSKYTARKEDMWLPLPKYYSMASLKLINCDAA